jgi:DNA-binding transcriptional ArsR family regulator
MNYTRSKTKVNPAELNEAAEMLKAIAHPGRLAILCLLIEKKSLTVTEIYETVNMEQAVASHHLGVLKSKGVLVCRREGKNILYSLKYECLSQIIDCIGNCGKI